MKKLTQKAVDITHAENAIHALLKELDGVSEELKAANATVKDTFANDAKFREYDEKVKESSRLRSSYNAAMSKDPAIQYMKDKANLLKSKKKDIQEQLSIHLKDYKNLSNSPYFETVDGSQLTIFEYFKLVKKS